jgi:hypothetical protein
MIEWGSLLLVAAVAIGATTVLVSLFSLGMRWLTDARHLVSSSKKGNSSALRNEVLFRSGAYILFTLCACAVVYGVYLIVPYFHLDK